MDDFKSLQVQIVRIQQSVSSAAIKALNALIKILYISTCFEHGDLPPTNTTIPQSVSLKVKTVDVILFISPFLFADSKNTMYDEKNKVL